MEEQGQEALCSRCHQYPRGKGQRWCHFCRNESRRRRRAERHVESATNAEEERTANGGRAEARDTPADGPQREGQAGRGHPGEPEVVPPGNRNGPNGHGNGWGGWNPRSKVATRVFLAALGRNNGEATRALIDKLAAIPLTEKNPWVLMAFWREFRNAVEGTPPKATPPPDARPRSRIVVQLGPEPAPPAEPEAAAPPIGEHDEDGERFVAVPPPD